MPGGTQDLGTTDKMEASWAISQLISIVLELRLHLASLSFPCTGNSEWPLLQKSVLAMLVPRQ